MPECSKLLRMKIKNIGCIGPEGLTIELDNILSIVGANNTGKSTVLRAYELVAGQEKFRPSDFCTWSEEEYASIELSVHLPKGIENVAEEWKTPENDLLIVKCKWEWHRDGIGPARRKTWDPQKNDYSETATASGLDEVFKSRLPKPFRIGTLEDPEQEHKKLLTLILQPIADKLKEQLKDDETELRQALKRITEIANIPVEEEQDNIDLIKNNLDLIHKEIFPDLKLIMKLGISPIEFNPLDALQRGSNLRFKEWDNEVDWDQQGTGSQRALFWAILQVRSKLTALKDAEGKRTKEISEKDKILKKIEKSIPTYKQEKTRATKREEAEKLKNEISELEKLKPEAMLSGENSELAMPGYMLLIDEPEVGLHPNAIRAASSYLYELAVDPSWQIILSTHSPLFVNPLHDHTTIVRLDRSNQDLSPKTYKAHSDIFDVDEKENMKMLNYFDQALAEMFFGHFPLLIEGDTEFAAFSEIMNSLPDKYPLKTRPVLIRARGKYPLIPIIKMLTHFKVPFSIIHDSDHPLRSNGNVNAAWTANSVIYKEILKARGNDIRVIHRVSIPNMELAHGRLELDDNGNIIESGSKEKPWKMLVNVKKEESIKDSISEVLDQLLNPDSTQEPFDGDFNERLSIKLREWAEKNSINDKKYRFE